MRTLVRPRRLAVAAALAALVLPAGAAPPPGTPSAPPTAGFPIRIGRTPGPTLYTPLGQLSAEERVKLAAVRLDEALADPACTPETFSLGDAGGRATLSVCGREILRVGPDDALVAGLPEGQLAQRWLDEIRPRFAREQAALYSSGLLSSAVLGIVIPVLWLAALIATRFLFLRLRSVLLHPRWHRSAVEAGGFTLLSASGLRRLLASLLAVLRWLAYLVLTYGFAVAMLRLIPTTSTYGVRLTELVWRAGREAGAGLLGLLPRLVLLALLALLLRTGLRAVSQSFGGSRTGEITIKLFLVALFGLAAGLLLPGPPGAALLAISAVLALVLVVGMRDLAADFLAGLALYYGKFVERGTRLRLGPLEGVVVSDGPFALTLRTDSGQLVRVPYRALARAPLEVAAPPRDPA